MEKENVLFDIVHFLEEYEKMPCLWNKINREFKDRIARSKAEEHLLAITGIKDVKTLRKKIRSIRGTYNTEVRKIKKSTKTGTGTGDVYVPKLFWFQVADRFLRPTTEIFSESNLQTDDDEDEEEEADGAARTEIDNPSMDNNATLNDSNTTVISSPSTRNTSESHPQRVVTKRPLTSRCRKKQISSIDNAVASLQNISNAHANNEFMTFGNSVAIQLGKLPLPAALKLQSEIQNLITETRLQYLQQDSSSDSSHPSSSFSTFSMPTPTATQQAQIFDEEGATNKIVGIASTHIAPPQGSAIQTYFSNWSLQQL